LREGLRWIEKWLGEGRDLREMFRRDQGERFKFV
jgi:hypothetical protein